jgi:nucleotide-binding universal stress UspA family protein
MYKHILIPLDGSAVAEKAVSGGIDFARETQARVTLFTAVPEYRTPSEAQLLAHGVESIVDHTRKSRELAGEILAGAEARARAAGLDVATDYACSNQPWEAIIAAARRHGCDAIFMGSHGRKGLAGFWHGSETREVLTHSDIPTLVYR